MPTYHATFVQFKQRTREFHLFKQTWGALGRIVVHYDDHIQFLLSTTCDTHYSFACYAVNVGPTNCNMLRRKREELGIGMKPGWTVNVVLAVYAQVIPTVFILSQLFLTNVQRFTPKPLSVFVPQRELETCALKMCYNDGNRIQLIMTHETSGTYLPTPYRYLNPQLNHPRDCQIIHWDG